VAAKRGLSTPNRREGATSFLKRLDDPGYRLPGESPGTATLADARRWAQTYDHLINFERELLELCEKFGEKSGPEVAQRIRETDMILLEVQVSRFQQKRDYWKIRATELAGIGRRGGAN
jgi:hypothetical protein